ncbi:olfactory receptor 4P4-like [Tachyglossus aculeatus]|uniref:olfactory receptor 4P4-like n=1 Tax=Tachyglossus aculeatus TaxID=9261 RepID=UPI0018F4C367|nr:olfactory receptor 4P4-like [Tachyglossus aculeatus]
MVMSQQTCHILISAYFVGALFYTIIAPMFNPFIYSVKYTDMKNAMRKLAISNRIRYGLSSDRNLQIFCFRLFLSCYIAILLGNFLILITVKCSNLFQQPMYFFLFHFSLMDVCYTSTVTPHLVIDMLSEKKTMSFDHCMKQLFALHLFGGIEIFILGTGLLRYLCDWILVLASSGTIELVTLAVWVFSYVPILASLRTHSLEGCLRAQTTCASHITVVTLLFLPSIFIYLLPAQIFHEDKVDLDPKREVE